MLPRFDGHLFVWATREVCHVGNGRTAVLARVSGGDGWAGEGWTEPYAKWLRDVRACVLTRVERLRVGTRVM